MASSSRLSDQDRPIRVTLFGAHGLTKRDLLSLPDPFAVLTVDGNQTSSTAVTKKSLSPSWNQTFEVTIKQSSMIAIQVFDFKKFKKRDQGFLGIVSISGADAISFASNRQEITGQGPKSSPSAPHPISPTASERVDPTLTTVLA